MAEPTGPPLHFAVAREAKGVFDAVQRGEGQYNDLGDAGKVLYWLGSGQVQWDDIPTAWRQHTMGRFADQIFAVDQMAKGRPTKEIAAEVGGVKEPAISPVDLLAGSPAMRLAKFAPLSKVAQGAWAMRNPLGVARSGVDAIRDMLMRRALLQRAAAAPRALPAAAAPRALPAAAGARPPAALPQTASPWAFGPATPKPPVGVGPFPMGPSSAPAPSAAPPNPSLIGLIEALKRLGLTLGNLSRMKGAP